VKKFNEWLVDNYSDVPAIALDLKKLKIKYKRETIKSAKEICSATYLGERDG
jgi:hypothetical protein